MHRGFAFAVALAGAAASTPAYAAPDPLPLRTVRFYETGVAYFERSGVLRGGDATRGVPLTLPLPTAQLDDALKSLVVISGDGKARLAGITFDSTVGPDLGRALAGLDGEGPGSLDWTRVLRSMKGADVVVRASRETVRGRLVDVLDAGADESTECVVETRPTGGAVPASTSAASAASERCVATRRASLVVLGDDGGVRRFRAPEVASVRPVDAALSARLRTALGSATPASDQRARGVRVLGESGSAVTLGYVTETPVWRSTYRVVFQKARAVLQGWALVHNDTDEAWHGVKVELVNGRPDAFLYPLAAPRYARRELVRPETPLSTVPQLLETGSPDRQWGIGAGGLGLSGVGEGGGGRGEGIGLGSIGTIGHGSGQGTRASDVATESTDLSVGDLAGVAGATGIEAEALFRYALPNALDLGAHASALVPFVQKPIAATRITWFSAPGESGRSGARLKNDTKNTLPAGTIAFFADGGFAGETLLDRMKPEEVRVVGFGLDQDVSLAVDDQRGAEETRRVRADGKGGLIVDFVQHRTLTCTFENRSSGDREVYFTLPVVDNAKVEGADGLDYDHHDKRALARFAVAKKSTLSRALVVQEGMRITRDFGSLTAETLERLAAAPALPKDDREKLLRSASVVRRAETERRTLAELVSSEKSASADVESARANLAATSRAADAGPFVSRLAAAEDALRAVRARITLSQRREAEAMAAAQNSLVTGW